MSSYPFLTLSLSFVLSDSSVPTHIGKDKHILASPVWENDPPSSRLAGLRRTMQEAQNAPSPNVTKNRRENTTNEAFCQRLWGMCNIYPVPTDFCRKRIPGIGKFLGRERMRLYVKHIIVGQLKKSHAVAKPIVAKWSLGGAPGGRGPSKFLPGETDSGVFPLAIGQ